MLGIGVGETIAIAVIVLVLFGARRIPQLGSGLAKGIKNFKRGLQEEEREKVGNQPEDSSDNEDR